MLNVMQEGEHINNYVEVVASTSTPAASEMRDRLLSESGTLTEGERKRLQEHFRV